MAVAPIEMGLSEVMQERKVESEEISPAYDSPSKEEVDYSSIWEANEASSLAELVEVEGWRKGFQGAPNPVPVAGGVRFPLQQQRSGDRQASFSSLAETILRRRSTRRFAHEGIPFEDLSTIIEASATATPFDFLPPEATLVDFYLMANQVTGLLSGAYFFDRSDGSLVQLKQGQFKGGVCVPVPGAAPLRGRKRGVLPDGRPRPRSLVSRSEGIQSGAARGRGEGGEALALLLCPRNRRVRLHLL